LSLCAGATVGVEEETVAEVCDEEEVSERRQEKHGGAYGRWC
jgi:hypothetical protein